MLTAMQILCSRNAKSSALTSVILEGWTRNGEDLGSISYHNPPHRLVMKIQLGRDSVLGNLEDMQNKNILNM